MKDLIVRRGRGLPVLLGGSGSETVADDPGVATKFADVVENTLRGINSPNKSKKSGKSERTKQATSIVVLPCFQLDIGTLDMLNTAPILYSFLCTLLGCT